MTNDEGGVYHGMSLKIAEWVQLRVDRSCLPIGQTWHCVGIDWAPLPLINGMGNLGRHFNVLVLRNITTVSMLVDTGGPWL